MQLKSKHGILVGCVWLGIFLSAAFSQERTSKPLQIIVYYSTIEGADVSGKGGKDSTLFRTTFFVYLKNVSESPVVVATRSPDWPDRMDESRVTMLSVSEKFTPVDQPVKQSPSTYAIVKLEKGEIASLGNFNLLRGEKPVDLDLHKFIYAVDMVSAKQLGLWQGEVINTGVQSTKEARAENKK